LNSKKRSFPFRNLDFFLLTISLAMIIIIIMIGFSTKHFFIVFFIVLPLFFCGFPFIFTIYEIEIDEVFVSFKTRLTKKSYRISEIEIMRFVRSGQIGGDGWTLVFVRLKSRKHKCFSGMILEPIPRTDEIYQILTDSNIPFIWNQSRVI
jgi:hypothetical protein